MRSPPGHASWHAIIQAMMSADQLIDSLKLQAHPEGGYYRETYRSNEKGVFAAGERNLHTLIYFLLESTSFSAFHRIRSDESWCYHAGATCTVYVIHPDGTLETMKTGPSPENGDNFQIIIPANCWFAAEVEGANNFTLVSCGVAPGFDFSDFELATRDRLCKEFPQHTALIQSFTRN